MRTGREDATTAPQTVNDGVTSARGRVFHQLENFGTPQATRNQTQKALQNYPGEGGFSLVGLVVKAVMVVVLVFGIAILGDCLNCSTCGGI